MAPVGTVYVGSNAGMLHAFSAEIGEERFAYVPNLIYDNLSDLTNPSYVHKYYIDKAPTRQTLEILLIWLVGSGKATIALISRVQTTLLQQRQ